MGWSWKVEEPPGGRQPGLRYEPGGWGDLLKGGVCAVVTRALAGAGSGPFAYLDPFAGAPAYPLLDTVRARLETVRGTDLAVCLEPFLADGAWPSAAGIVRVAAERAGRSLEATVLDADPDRREAWAEAEGVRLAGASSGWDLIPPADPVDLCLVDPYDLDKVWRERVADLLATARRTSVLAYLYNRSPRGPNRLEEYEAFRDALAAGRPDDPVLVCRVPADGRLPRAFHEMIWLPAPGLDASVVGESRDAIRDFATDLGLAIAREGLVEEG